MARAVETVVYGHVVGFYIIPVAVEQTFLGGLIADLVQSRLVGLSESDVGIVEHREGHVIFALARDNLVPVVVLHEAAANPVRRGVGRHQHLRYAERLVHPPADTREEHLYRALGDLRAFVDAYGAHLDGAEALEMRVGRQIRHFEHQNDRAVPELERAGQIVDLVVDVLCQPPILDHRTDGVPCGFLETFEGLAGDDGPEVRETQTAAHKPHRHQIRFAQPPPAAPPPRISWGIFEL